jgi:8-oxo-dGTP pyrophosphatase MutT (NUDIX family)
MFRRIATLGSTQSRFHRDFSSSLSQALPHLRRRLKDLANDKGDFPLLTTKQSEAYLKHRKESREAAVLVLMCTLDETPSILLTKRAAHLDLHAAEISFPGGHWQESDTNLQETALRETREELLPTTSSNHLETIEIFGNTETIPTLKGTPVTAVLAYLPTPLTNPLPFPGDPSEVDLVFGVSIDTLLKVESSQALPTNRFGMTLGPTFPLEQGNVWGLTAMILRPLLHKWLKPGLYPK